MNTFYAIHFSILPFVMLFFLDHSHAEASINLKSKLSDEDFISQSTPYFTYCYKRVGKTQQVDTYEFFYRRHKTHRYLIRVFRVNYGRGKLNGESHLVDLVRQRVLRPDLIEVSVHENDLHLTLAISSRVIPELFERAEETFVSARLENLESENSILFYFLKPISSGEWLCPTSVPFDPAIIFLPEPSH